MGKHRKIISVKAIKNPELKEYAFPDIKEKAKAEVR